MHGCWGPLAVTRNALSETSPRLSAISAITGPKPKLVAPGLRKPSAGAGLHTAKREVSGSSRKTHDFRKGDHRLREAAGRKNARYVRLLGWG